MKRPCTHLRRSLTLAAVLLGAASLGLAAVGLTLAHSNGSNRPSGDARTATIASPGLVTVLDLAGDDVDPFADSPGRVAVLLFTRTDCPIANRYAPEWRRLCKKFSAQRVAFYLIYADPDESAEVVRRHLDDYRLPGLALRDPRGRLAKLLGASVTPEAAVLAGDGRLTYRGRIDDRFVDFGQARAQARRRDLQQAIEATLAGREVSTPRTRAVGCPIPQLP